AEEKLATDPDGHRLVKELRTRLIEGSRDLLDEMVERLTGIEVVSLHSDISLQMSERIFVIVLAEDLESRLKR
ncbi:MAG: Na-translocating system protein MpsC family protein, partial [Anaerolineae bacterium]